MDTVYKESVRKQLVETENTLRDVDKYISAMKRSGKSVSDLILKREQAQRNIELLKSIIGG